MSRLQYQRGSEPVLVPAADVVQQPYVQMTRPIARRVLSAAILSTACFYAPTVLAGPPTASGAAQGGAGLVRRASLVQYQGLAGPVAIGETLTSQQVAWKPTYPDRIPRPRIHPSQQRTVVDQITFAGPAASTGIDWILQRPEPVRRVGPHPSRIPFIGSPVGVGFGHVSWSYPDSIDPKRAIGRSQQATQYVSAPVFVEGVTQVAPALSWAPAFPARVLRFVVPASQQQALTFPVFVPDVSETVPAVAWEAQYPDQVIPPPKGLGAHQQQALAWYPVTPGASLGTPINEWAIYPDRVYGKTHPLSGRQFELVAPLFLSDVTEGAISLGWLPSAPDQIAAALRRPHLYPDVVWPFDVAPDWVASVYPDRIASLPRLLDYQAITAPLVVPDVTEPVPPFDGWQGSAEVPVRVVRTIHGLGQFFAHPGLDGLSPATGGSFFVVDVQGRWFLVTPQGRWFLVRAR